VTDNNKQEKASKSIKYQHYKDYKEQKREEEEEEENITRPHTQRDVGERESQKWPLKADTRNCTEKSSKIKIGSNYIKTNACVYVRARVCARVCACVLE